MPEKPNLPQCPACGSSRTRPVLDARDHTVSGEAFHIHQCEDCRLRFTYPVPSPAEIGRYYQSEEYISHTDTQRGLINKLYHGIRKISLAQKKKWITREIGLRSGTLLDIGCGTGHFLREMRSSGWQVTGLEPDEKARAIALSRSNITALAPEELFRLPSESFDVITLWHVLEHVHQLHPYMEEIKRLLRAEGKLFIAVPNYASKDQEVFGADWAAYDVPRHLYHFCAPAMKRLIESHGFRLHHIKAMPFDGFYISLLSEKYKHGGNRYVAGFINGVKSWLHGRGNPSKASSILYILEHA
jgi:2-polyprenyl-3-methyl-5-hydroxy-6-metoxy-1,4-benzoquinol methylase